MSAVATECMPLPAATNTSQQHSMTQYQMRFKEEVLDPGYGNSTIPVSNGISHSSGNGCPIPSSSSPAVSNPTVSTGAPAPKAKRSYTRKPSGAPKAKKVKSEPVAQSDANAVANGVGQSQIGDHMPVQKKKRDRFKGTTEEEVLKRVLPDHIREDLDILIVGINPGLTAAYVQHHYAGPGNHFWKCLYLSGMIPEPMNALQDAELLNFGIGFTNIVARTTRGSADLSRKEIFEGGEILKTKMLKYLPKIALFNGKGIYEVFCGHKNFNFGLQPDPFPGCPDTCVFVNPSSSARCTQLPRAVDKVPFYEALKRVRDHIRVHGSVDGIDRSTVTFPDFKLVTAPQKNKVKEEPKEAGDTDKKAESAPKPKPTKEPTTKVAKPRKPRGRPKKETNNTGIVSETAIPSSDAHNSTNQTLPQQQSFVNSNLPSKSDPPADVSQPVQNGQPNDFHIKQEVMDNSHNDKDLAAIIQHSIAQQSIFQQRSQQSILTSNSISHPVHRATIANNMPHSISNPNINPALMMSSTPSSVKQERPDWNGYGVMPSYTSTPPTSLPYPQLSCYWNYLPPTTSLMNNAYSNIPVPQIAHQQALAAAAALHTSVNANQPTNVSSAANAAPAVSYNSPQEASSPAMSSQSNLTQASLDSLPKADSASTVANWLQSIPHSS